jgi:flavin-dependent dehydrogenase
LTVVPASEPAVSRAVLSRVDVLIVGGGAAGSATGITLARLGASVLVADRSAERPLLGESVPPAATPHLQELGVWERFAADAHAPSYGNHSSWGRPEIDEYDFIRSPYGAGRHLDRARFDDMMRAAVAEAGGTVQSATRLIACRQALDGRWHCTLSSGRTRRDVCAGFVVDASGRARSFVRTQGAKRRVYDRLVGVIGVLRPTGDGTDSDTFTLIEAARDGWWYGSGLPDGRLVIGCMTDADLAAESRVRSAACWNSMVKETVHVRDRVGRGQFQLEAPPRLVAADSSRLDTMTGPGWCVVGDAAAAYDPLSSQGILSALAGGISAGKAIAGAESGGLAEYEDEIRHAYAAYRARWMAYYAQEQRWPASPFWRRRHDALDSLLRGKSS